MQQQVTRCRLEALLHYDEITGEFTWRAATSNRVKVGMRAGTLHSEGYVRVKVDGMQYFAHRLAWLYVYGHWPEADLDHINGNRADNRIGNLRGCTRAENLQNLGNTPNKKSGLPLGVSFSRSGKYRAQIRHSGTSRWLGLYTCPEEAHAAYLTAKAELHPFNPVPRKGL